MRRPISSVRTASPASLRARAVSFKPSKIQRRHFRRREHQRALAAYKTPASSPRFRASPPTHLAIARIRRSSGRFHIRHRAHPVSAFMHIRAWRQAGSYRRLFGPVNVGPWPNIGGNANIVPTVSNGRVYVASWETLAILSSGGSAPAAVAAVAEAAAPAASAVSPNTAFVISGTLRQRQWVGAHLHKSPRQREIDQCLWSNKERSDCRSLERRGSLYGARIVTDLRWLNADVIYRAKCGQHTEAGGNLLPSQPARLTNGRQIDTVNNRVRQKSKRCIRLRR